MGRHSNDRIATCCKPGLSRCVSVSCKRVSTAVHRSARLLPLSSRGTAVSEATHNHSTNIPRRRKVITGTSYTTASLLRMQPGNAQRKVVTLLWKRSHRTIDTMLSQQRFHTNESVATRPYETERPFPDKRVSSKLRCLEDKQPLSMLVETCG